MKTRYGFVSNSSSSSFIIRGVKLKTQEVITLFNLDISKFDTAKPTNFDAGIADSRELASYLNKEKLTCHTIRSYFDGDESGELIIGYPLETGSDGEVFELEEVDDSIIINKLKNIGINPMELRTYTQYISNDNY